MDKLELIGEEGQFSVRGEAWGQCERELEVEVESGMQNFLYSIHGESDVTLVVYRNGEKQAATAIKLGTDLDKKLHEVGKKEVTEGYSVVEDKETEGVYMSVDEAMSLIQREKEEKKSHTYTEETKAYFKLQATEDARFIISNASILLVDRALKNDEEREQILNKVYKELDGFLVPLDFEDFVFKREKSSIASDGEKDELLDNGDEGEGNEELEIVSTEDTVRHLDIAFVAKTEGLDFNTREVKQFQFARIVFTNKYTAKKLVAELEKSGIKLGAYAESILVNKNYFLVYGDTEGLSDSFADSVGIPREYMKVVASNIYKESGHKYRLFGLGIGHTGLFSFVNGVYMMDTIVI